MEVGQPQLSYFLKPWITNQVIMGIGAVRIIIIDSRQEFFLGIIINGIFCYQGKWDGYGNIIFGCG